MTTETAQKTAAEPFEINGITAKLPVSREDTESESKDNGLKKPRESKVFNHGTGYVTFVQACKLITASRSTLARYSNEGKISFETDENGHKLYQVVELQRVFGKLKSPDTNETGTENEEKDHLAPEQLEGETALRIAELEADKRVLEAQLQAEREKGQLLKELAEKEARNADDLRQAMKVLTYRPEQTPTPQPELQQQQAPEPKKGFLGRFFGGGNG